MREALVIVHLSSIQNYLLFFGEDAAINLAAQIKLAIYQHSGPVLILDQQDEQMLDADGAALRAFVLEAPAVLIHHDEMQDKEPWQAGFQPIVHQLQNWSVQRARLGGLWASEHGKSGCVHEACKQLRHAGIPTYVDKHICGFEGGTPYG